ncbi:MAG: nitroreductase [Bacilli bacterium]|nr:nitroreductase [Bacilli bacterium]
MDALTAMKQRRSCRKFDPNKEVEQEKLDKILEAGLYAPTGVGSQSPRFIVIRNKKERDDLMRLNAKILGRGDIDPFYGAPVIVLVVVDKKAPCAIYDGALAMGNLMNAAEALGVSSIWIHRAKQEIETEEGKALLKRAGLEGDFEGIGHCCLGYGENPTKFADRKPGRVAYID